jgi:1-acyl-sn-glycerol-3-phosphate acyltransferase
MKKKEHCSEFSLFKQRRFGPYFFTQFLGAFNDNLFKSALMVLVAIELINTDPNQAHYINNIGAGAFILPFFIFSATAGQLADKYAKPKVIRTIKLAEILITVMIGVGFYLHSFVLLVCILCLLGTQSAFFSPVKYSILPEYLTEEELTSGNGLVEMGTFVAILLGTICGGLCIGIADKGPLIVSILTFFVAVAGWALSLLIPKAISPNKQPHIKINWNIFKQTWYTIKLSAQSKTIFLTIMGISWFWFFGSILLTQIPNYTKQYFGGDATVLTLMLATASIGIGLGSIWCDKLCGHKVEIGLVPFGSFGITIFCLDFSFAHPPAPLGDNIGIMTFISNWHGIHVLIDIFLMGLFGGFFSVPLYVLLQTRCIKESRSRTIAANSIFNALFMALASLLAIGLITLGLSLPNMFFVLGLLNLAVALYIYKLIPEFLLRFFAWILIHSVYRLDARAIENIPHDGPAIITCNHVSFLDPIVIMAAIPRPVRFVMDHRIFKIPLLKSFFKAAGCIPIAPAKEDPTVKEAAFEKVSELLKEGELIGIFPEGGICKDGELQHFRPGIDRIIKDTPVSTYPLYLEGLWGSFFSRKNGKAMMHWPRLSIFHPLTLQAGDEIKPNDFNMDKLEVETKKLMEE